MNECIFCKIAAGEIPVHKIYEDEKTFVFLDKHPINPGHMLVIPKIHEPDFYKLDHDYYQPLMDTVRFMASNMAHRVEQKKVGLIVAGWDVPHTHVHIVPMKDYNDITSKSLLEGNRANPTDDELAETALRLRDL
jgi:histidine triad (HIT) family protein